MSKSITHVMAKACALETLGRWGTWATQRELVDDACVCLSESRDAVTEPMAGALQALVSAGMVVQEDGTGGWLRFRLA